MPLEEAKRAAVAMLLERRKAEPRDWIGELNQIAANEVDRAVIQRERRKWPLDLMGGSRRGAADPGPSSSDCMRRVNVRRTDYAEILRKAVSRAGKFFT